jgi:predicted ATPase
MIRSIEFTNYRSLRKARLDLGPLTVLVGGNGTGKSSVLRAIRLETNLGPDDVTNRVRSGAGAIEIAREDGTKTRIDFDSDNRADIRGPRVRCQLIHLDLGRMRQPIQLAPQPELSADGGNIANVWDSLTRARKQELSQQFCELVPLYADVDEQALGNGNLTLRFQDRWSKVWYQPSQVSDGTMLVLAYLLLLRQETPIDLIAIEEPERGLHPYLLGHLVRLLRAMSRGEVGGRAVQIVAATHSADLLNHLEPDEVRFLSRDDQDGMTIIESVRSGDPGWRQAFTEYDASLGTMWLSGGLGGVPGR